MKYFVFINVNQTVGKDIFGKQGDYIFTRRSSLAKLLSLE